MCNPYSRKCDKESLVQDYNENQASADDTDGLSFTWGIKEEVR